MIIDQLDQPTLDTERLVLRSFGLEDAPDVQRLAGEREVADTTINIPHPYRDGLAEAWILSHKQLYRAGAQATFAVTLRGTGTLVGAVGLRIVLAHDRGELGYWIGRAYWGQGYCTEASQSVLHFAFHVLRLNRVHAMHLVRNPASGRVMQKLGMSYEGRMRAHFKKWECYEDVDLYAILRSDYSA